LGMLRAVISRHAAGWVTAARGNRACGAGPNAQSPAALQTLAPRTLDCSGGAR
jgi:hypothetical protein